MAHCKDCLHFKVCEAFGKTVKFPVDDGVCLHFAKDTNVLTNADRIRAMSDEELAKAVGHRSLCYYIQDETNFCNEREVCGDCIREWLKQPADMRGEEDG